MAAGLLCLHEIMFKLNVVIYAFALLCYLREFRNLKHVFLVLYEGVWPEALLS